VREVERIPARSYVLAATVEIGNNQEIVKFYRFGRYRRM
jgi:hypothetical protein